MGPLAKGGRDSSSDQKLRTIAGVHLPVGQIHELDVVGDTHVQDIPKHRERVAKRSIRRVDARVGEVDDAVDVVRCHGQVEAGDAFAEGRPLSWWGAMTSNVSVSAACTGRPRNPAPPVSRMRSV